MQAMFHQTTLLPKTALLIAGLALSGLSACDPDKFNHEAGFEVQESGFGSATASNTALMSGEISATTALAGRFASEVPNTITFAFNSSALSDDARATLVIQANWIRQFPEVRFRVYGHTDLVGSNAYNKALGLRRAQAAVAFLGSQGISIARLEAVASFGETQPVIFTLAPEQRNRRTVTEVTGFTRGASGLLNGKYAAVIMREYIESATRPIATQTQVTNEVTPQ